MSGRIVSYRMVASEGTDGFDECVYRLNEAVEIGLKAGWKLYGTPFASNGVLYQAMVKEEFNNKGGGR